MYSTWGIPITIYEENSTFCAYYQYFHLSILSAVKCTYTSKIKALIMFDLQGACGSCSWNFAGKTTQLNTEV